MKKIALLAISMLIFSAGLNAQKMNAIKTDLFSVFLRTGVIKYERAFNEHLSGQLGFFYTGYSPNDVDASLSGWGITPEVRLYLSDTPAPVGTYLAPNFRYMSLIAEDEISLETATLTSFGIAVNLGKQWMFKDIVVIDGWVGPAYNFRTLDDPSGDVDVEGADGFGIRLGIALGIVF
ncbi:MAG: DUF3575 domain-containing protein [Bacteroidota bacterium]|nr:DUF3575 domain-containing protein [Bacteroidota bacterium]